ncbi:MAG: inner membrane CreD family protein, partial [Gemmatimonadaceae bacterium]
MDSIAGAFRRVLGSPGFKFFLICGLILILTIPLLLVWALIEEREQRAESVRADVAREWGAAQSIIGPVLIVPYTVRHVTTQGDKRVEELLERRAVFLPQTLNVHGKATTKVLHRAIYDVAVYTGSLEFEGRFDSPDMSEVSADVDSVRWRDAILALAINDVSGLRSTASALIDSATKLAFEPSIGIPDDRLNGIHVRLAGATGLFGDAAPTAQPAAMHGFAYK